MLGSNGLLECCGLSGDHRVVLGSTSQRCIIIVMEPDVALAEELAGWDASHKRNVGGTMYHATIHDDDDYDDDDAITTTLSTTTCILLAPAIA